MDKENECDDGLKHLIQEQTKAMTEVNKAYIKRLQYVLDKIEETITKENKDRLDYAHIINESVQLLGASVKGWEKWTNIRTMHDVMTDKELKETSAKMFELVKAWIQIDIDITKDKIKADEKKIKKRVKQEGNYVS